MSQRGIDASTFTDVRFAAFQTGQKCNRAKVYFLFTGYQTAPVDLLKTIIFLLVLTNYCSGFMFSTYRFILKVKHKSCLELWGKNGFHFHVVPSCFKKSAFFFFFIVTGVSVKKKFTFSFRSKALLKLSPRWWFSKTSCLVYCNVRHPYPH